MLTNDKKLRERAYQVIPGGMYGHQSAKPFSEDFPQFYSKAQGAYLWDYDGNQYIDYLCGYGTNLLGYLDPRIEKVAAEQQKIGDTMSGPSGLMVQLAEDFTQMITHADWAMFCKNGSDATSMALVCSRAYKNRSKVLIADGTYHGAHTWNTPRLEGITAEDRSNIVYFQYNDIDSLKEAIKSVDGQFAAIFATPFRHEVLHDQYMVTKEYAEFCRSACDEYDALLVVDEVRTGFRLSRDCFWTSEYGVDPDLSTWGKAIGNGYPISALLGSQKARDAAERIFVTGSYWYSAVPMAAAIETLKIIRDTNYLETMQSNANALREGIAIQAEKWGYGLKQTGPAEMPQMLFEDDATFALGKHWTASIMKQGAFFSFYHNMFISEAHTAADIQKTLEYTDYAFSQLKNVK
ncbi:aminotransferase class III-fold pyridoxal phosphate-dependent enzyme [Acinetobacter baumannii]|uniref:aminotransferase class III-fold pyridoxal phosphate-dependent enzyme n=1 Tax=Acinetobacter baumannii TaxID=470 RepID=UPI002449451F|nr:aminotransferase class III-fold pyridoxal phosphate-dependent enzyme [Acinetobacter baumannii]MDH2528296.1 aminotransferase class III-fold pyridoxal phosphate-dependent enzyme [Acinetobacter baumannii]